MPAVTSTLQDTVHRVLLEVIGQGLDGETERITNKAIDDDSMRLRTSVLNWSMIAIIAVTFGACQEARAAVSL